MSFNVKNECEFMVLIALQSNLVAIKMLYAQFLKFFYVKFLWLYSVKIVRFCSHFVSLK